MRNEIVFEDGEITGMLANPAFVAAFPAIAALRPAPVPGDCPPCKAKAEQRRIASAHGAIRQRLAALTQDEWNTLLDILEARRAVLIYYTPANARVRRVFQRTDLAVS